MPWEWKDAESAAVPPPRRPSWILTVDLAFPRKGPRERSGQSQDGAFLLLPPPCLDSRDRSRSFKSRQRRLRF